MKWLKLLFCSLLIFLFISCGENNKGPFEIRKDGVRILLYSDGKPAEGWIEKTRTDEKTGMVYKEADINYDDGYPTGEFKLYDSQAFLVVQADLKLKNRYYVGEVNYYFNEYTKKLKGSFSIRLDLLVPPNSHIPLGTIKEIENYIVTGSIEKISNNGELISREEYKDGVFSAGTKEYNENGFRIKENYKDGKLDGTRYVYNTLNDLISKQTYKAGKLDGPSEYLENENLIKEIYKDDKLDGIRETYDKNKNLILKENYKDGELNGEVVSYNADGSLEFKQNYKDGKLNGESVAYNFDGSISYKENYKDGLLDGLLISYEDGPLTKATYKDGKLNGKFEVYDEKNNLVETKIYKEDVLNKMEQYNVINNSTEILIYKDNEPWEGTSVGELYYDDDSVQFRYTYKTGNLILTETYVKKKQMFKANHKNDKIWNGSILNEDKNSNLIKETYKDGKLISKELYDINENKTIPSDNKDSSNSQVKSTKDNITGAENKNNNMGENFSVDDNGIYTALSPKGLQYQIINEIEPDYPEEAENIGYSKKVIVSVEFLVDLKGNIEKAEIIKSHKDLGFDAEVLKAIKKWKFKPIYHNGKNIKVYFVKDFEFNPK